MDLAEFREKYQEDDNVFWQLDLGEMQNLLEEAIETIEKFEKDRPKPLTSSELLHADSRVRNSNPDMGIGEHYDRLTKWINNRFLGKEVEDGKVS